VRERVTSWLRARSAVCHYSLLGLRRVVTLSQSWRAPVVANRSTVPEDRAEADAWADRNGAHEVLQHVLTEMNRICTDRGVAFLATRASRGPKAYKVCALREAAFAADCKAAGVRFVSIQDCFTGDPLAYASRRVDGRYDPHFNSLGTKTYAKALAPVIAQILRSGGLGRDP